MKKILFTLLIISALLLSTCQNSIEVPSTIQPYSNVRFLTSIEINPNDLPMANNLKISSVKARKAGDDIQFCIDVSSDIVRNYVFFDPPDGNTIKLIVTEGIKTERSTIEFKISIADLKKVSSAAMLFYENNNPDEGGPDFKVMNFISLNYDDINNLF